MFRLGQAAGALMAPAVAAVAAIRRARMFHPEGIVYRGRVTVAPMTPWPDVAARLAGSALVRLSSAWWRAHEWPDVLGVAIRFTRRDQPAADADADDQDLLLATVKSPWTLGLAPLTTAVHDFFANRYYGVSPFAVDGIGRAEFRIVPPGQASATGDRAARLAQAVAAGTARWQLEVRPSGARDWSPLAEVKLIANVTAQIDQARLRFSPFRDARGLVPVGFVQGLRRAAYAASQEARPHGEPTTVAARPPRARFGGPKTRIQA